MSGDLETVFAERQRYARSRPIPDAKARKAVLRELELLVRDNAQGFVEAISSDFGGRASAETELMEVIPAVRAIRHSRRNVAKWMKPERRHVDIVFQPGRAWVRYEPLGLVGIISPWNYPLQLAIVPLCDALAAGNVAMLKPSELTPATSALLAKLLKERLGPDHVTVIEGDVAVGQAFSRLPFDHLFFTGSTNVGREVMKAAAENLTPVTLELGGKSPAIVAPDYGIDKAAASIAFGKFVNAGQTCIAPDYALVPRGSVDRFADAVASHVAKSYPDSAENPQYTAIITPRHRARLATMIDEAKAAGARILSDGRGGDNEPRLAPTVVVDPPRDSRLMTEEIFGPVLPVVPYDTIDDAVRFVGDRDRPLAMYLYSNDGRTRESVLSRTISGGVTLNGTLLHLAQDSLPFGGVGPSGQGAYHGIAGFRRLSHARAVYAVGPVNVFEKLGPPWGPASRLVTRMLERF